MTEATKALQEKKFVSMFMMEERSTLQSRCSSNLQDTQSQQSNQSNFYPKSHLQSPEDACWQNCKCQIGSRVEYSLHITSYHLHIRRPTLARRADRIPQCDWVLALREYRDTGEKVDNQSLCHHGVKKHSARACYAKDSKHEDHERDSA